MKRYILPALLFTCSYCLLLVVEVAVAEENSGCLTCHQYPGLVRMGKDGTVKMLHIDADAYFKSVHGELRCLDCHVGIDEIPHAGDRSVECYSTCHVTPKEREMVQSYSLDDIHRGQQSMITRLPDQTSCKVCHSIYPHSQKTFVSSLLNMHTGYIVCEVCHLNKNAFPSISYGWVTTQGVEFKGMPFGSFYDPRQEALLKPQGSLSRISAFVQENGRGTPLMRTGDRAKAQEYKLSEKHLDSVQKNRAMQSFHKDIRKMELPSACEACHSQDGWLDFRSLGFSEVRATELINLNIKGIISKYKTFYLPKMFSP